MRREAEAAGYDSDRLPLEKLSKVAIREAFSALKAVEKALQQPQKAGAASALLAPSRAFFAAVPCRGAEDGVVIDSLQALQERHALLQLLADVEPVYAALLKLQTSRKRRRPGDPSQAPDPEALVREAREGQGRLKRPPSPFFLFFSETRSAIAKELGEAMSFGADAKRAAEVWRTLPKRELRAYQKRYRASREEYDKEQQLMKAQEDALISAESVFRQRYQMMACNIEPLTMGSSTWMLVYEYVRSSQPQLPQKLSSAGAGARVLRAVRIFALSRHGEDERFAKHADDPNRMLLWHPARPNGLAAALSRGLRAAPRDGPAAGRSLGRGLHFTDAAGGAAAAALRPPSGGEGGCQGLLLLAEVALGECHKVGQPAPKLERAPDGCDSVCRPGSMAADPANACELPGGVSVPLGPMTKAKVPSGSPEHTEYAVYDPSQVRLRYIVEVCLVAAASAAELDAAAADANARPRRIAGKTAAALAPWAEAGA